MSDCIFCRIVAGEAPAHVVAEDARTVAFRDYPTDPDFLVLADSEGNRFCIVDASCD